MTVENVFPKVKSVIADVLVIDESDVELNKSLVGDLGAESIDFLDLVFQLEREFSIKIPRGQLEKNARGDLSEDEFSKKGVVSAQGMEALRRYFTEIPADRITEPFKVGSIPSLFTVETFCKLVVHAQSEVAAA